MNSVTQDLGEERAKHGGEFGKETIMLSVMKQRGEEEKSVREMNREDNEETDGVVMGNGKKYGEVLINRMEDNAVPFNSHA